MSSTCKIGEPRPTFLTRASNIHRLLLSFGARSEAVNIPSLTFLITKGENGTEQEDIIIRRTVALDRIYNRSTQKEDQRTKKA